MFLSIGGTSLTSSSPIHTSPVVAWSSPAAIRSTVVLPEPDGPTTTMNSPSPISRLRPSTAWVPPGKIFVSSRKSIFAIASLPSVRGRDPVAVPERAAFRDPGLGGEVDEHDPESFLVAVLPLEVVEQRPHVVAADVGSLGAGALERLDVAVDVRQPPVVVDGAVAVHLVVERSAVLCDHERDVPVVTLEPEQQLGQRGRHHRPAHRRVLDVEIDVSQAEHRPVVIRRDDVRPVEVDAEEVERLRDQLEVTLLDRI